MCSSKAIARFLALLPVADAVLVGSGAYRISISNSYWFDVYGAGWDQYSPKSTICLSNFLAQSLVDRNPSANLSLDLTYYNTFGQLDKQYAAITHGADDTDIWVGPARSNGVQLTATILNIFQVPQIHLSADPTWADRSLYGYAFSILGSASDAFGQQVIIVARLNMRSYSYAGRGEAADRESEAQLFDIIQSKCEIAVIGPRLFYPQFSADGAEIATLIGTDQTPTDEDIEAMTSVYDELPQMHEAWWMLMDPNTNPSRIIWGDHSASTGNVVVQYFLKFGLWDHQHVFFKVGPQPFYADAVVPFGFCRFRPTPNPAGYDQISQILGTSSAPSEYFANWMIENDPHFFITDPNDLSMNNFSHWPGNDRHLWPIRGINTWQYRIFDAISFTFETLQRMIDADSLSVGEESDSTAFITELTSGWVLNGIQGRLSMQPNGYPSASYGLHTANIVTGVIDSMPCATVTTGLVSYEPGACVFVNGSSTMESFFPPGAPESPLVQQQPSGVKLSWTPGALRSTPFVEHIIQAEWQAEWGTVYNSTVLTSLAATVALSPGTYRFRVATVGAGGQSPWSVPTSSVTISGTCQVSGCGDYAECLTGAEVCTCLAGLQYLSPVDSMSCAPLFTPCNEYSCLGSFGTCDISSGICSCDEGTVLAEMAGKDTTLTADLLQAASQASDGEISPGWKTCVLDMASSAEAREFWTLSLWLSAWGLLGAILMAREFTFNEQLRYPNTMMQAFISFAVPDLILASMNFVVYILQLVQGDSLGSATGVGGYSETGCTVVAFIMYIVVVCTYFAPVMVALSTYLKFHSVAQGKASFAVASPIVIVACVGLPSLLGISLAAATYSTAADDGESTLGSYRGLYCFIRRWDPSITWAVLATFMVAVFLTITLYLMAILKVSAIVKNSGSNSSKAAQAVMKRGVYLTVNFIGWWIWFVVTSAISASQTVIPIAADYAGAILINAQPIVDCIIILSMPNVRAALLERQLKSMGISVSSSSSSSSFPSKL